MGIVNTDYSDDDKESLWQKTKKILTGDKNAQEAKQPPPRRTAPDIPKYPVGTLVRNSEWKLCTVAAVRKKDGVWEYQLSPAASSTDKKAPASDEWLKEGKVYKEDESID